MICIESCLKYFIIQRIGSVVFLIFIYINILDIDNIGIIILCYKIGGGPFYFWFVYLCDNISWLSCFFLIIFQKIIPLILISFFIGINLWLVRFIRLVVGVGGRINQNGLKRLIAYSSVHHIGWIIIRLIFRDIFWFIYLLIYIIIVVGLFNFYWYNNINTIVDVFKSDYKLILFINFLNLGGVPPFLGFFLKLWALYFFIICDYRLVVIIIIFSVFILYIYFRIFYDYILGRSIKNEVFLVKYEYLLQWDVLFLIGTILGSFFGTYFFF